MVTAFDPACVATGGQEAVDVGAFTENSREIVGSGYVITYVITYDFKKVINNMVRHKIVFISHFAPSESVISEGMAPLKT